MSATPPYVPQMEATSEPQAAFGPPAARTANKGCFYSVKGFVCTVSLFYTPTPKFLSPSKNDYFADSFLMLDETRLYRDHSSQKSTSLAVRLQTAGFLAMAQREALREIPHFAARLFSEKCKGTGDGIFTGIKLVDSIRVLWWASRRHVTNIFCERMSKNPNCGSV